METIIVLLICAFLALAYGFYNRKAWQVPKSTFADERTVRAYQARPNIFVNASEGAFFNALVRHKPRDFYIFAKVRLEDVLCVRSDVADPREHWQYRGRIKSRHVDFVICTRTGKYVCAIELDGTAHSTDQSDMTDAFKDAIFSHANLALYRVQTGVDFDQYSRKLWEKLKL